MWVCAWLRIADGTVGCLFFLTSFPTGREKWTAPISSSQLPSASELPDDQLSTLPYHDLGQVMIVLASYKQIRSPSHLRFIFYYLKPTQTCKLHTREDLKLNSGRPPAVPNRSKISKCTPKHVSTFVSAVSLRAPPGWNCPIYNFNLAPRVRAVSCGPISDDLQMHTYDLKS